MKRADRIQAQLLESIMERHRAWEKRTLIDLRQAGFTGLETIEDAYRRLDAQREFAGFTQQQIDIALYAMEKRRRDRQKASA